MKARWRTDQKLRRRTLTVWAVFATVSAILCWVVVAISIAGARGFDWENLIPTVVWTSLAVDALQRRTSNLSPEIAGSAES